MVGSIGSWREFEKDEGKKKKVRSGSGGREWSGKMMSGGWGGRD